MSNVVTSGLKWLPSAALGQSITPSGTAWAYSSWVQISASMAAKSQLGALTIDTADATSAGFEIEIGVGASGSEQTVAVVRGYYQSSVGQILFPLPILVDKIPSGSRVSVRMRKAGVSTTVWRVAIGYYENETTGQMLAGDPVVYPAGSNAPTVTPAGSAWGNSSYVELSSNVGSSDVYLQGISINPAGTAAVGFELDLATGASGSETVLTTIRGRYDSNAGMQIIPLGFAVKVPSGSRLSFRLRKNNTDVTTWAVGAYGMTANQTQVRTITGTANIRTTTQRAQTGKASIFGYNPVERLWQSLGSQSTNVTTSSFTPASGSSSSLVAIINIWTGGTINTLTDSQGNTWTRRVNQKSGNNCIEIWTCDRPVQAATTLTLGISAFINQITVKVYEVSTTLASAYDTSTTNTGNSGTITTGNITTTADGDALLWVGMNDVSTTMALPSGYVNGDTRTTSNFRVSFGWKQAGNAGTGESTSSTMGQSWNWSGAVLALKTGVPPTQQTQTGKARISLVTSQSQTGKANIDSPTKLRTITGKGSIVNSVSRSQTGKAAIVGTVVSTAYEMTMGYFSHTGNTWGIIGAPWLYDASEWDGTQMSAFMEGTFYIQTGSGTAQVRLYDVTAGAAVSGVTTLSTTATTGFITTRSLQDIRPYLIDGHQYRMEVTGPATDSVVYIAGSRLVFTNGSVGAPTKLTSYIPLTPHENGFTRTTYAENTYSHKFLWESSKFDGTVAVYFEAGLNNANVGQTTYAELYDLTAGASVSGSEVSATGTGWTRNRSGAITLIDGHTYVVRDKVSGINGRLAQSHLVIKQTGSITKTQLHRSPGTIDWGNTEVTAGADPLPGYTQFRPAEFIGVTGSWYLVATLFTENALGTVNVQAYGNTIGAFGTPMTSSSTTQVRVKSSALTMPSSNEFITSQVWQSNASYRGTEISRRFVFDAVFGATTTRDQTGKARIQYTTSKTQTGVARITKTVSQAQTGKARIQQVVSRNQTGTAKITATTQRAQTGKAAIKVTQPRTITGVSRITVSVARTQTGKARITATASQAQTGKSRISLVTARTQTGVAKITATTTRAQLGTSRITITTSKPQTGVAKVTATTQRGQQGKANVRNAVLRTITGTSRITATTARAQTGRASVLNAVSRTQVGVARIQKTVSQSQTGVARIAQAVNRTQTGVSRIGYVTPRTITGQSRITVVVPRAQTGKAKITATTSRPQTGVSRITATTAQSQTGKAAVKKTTTRDQLGKAAVLRTTARTQTGVSRISLVSSRNQLGLSRIERSVSRQQVGLSRITAIVSRGQSGKAAVRNTSTRDQQGRSRIELVTQQPQLGTMNVLTGGQKVISGTSRIQLVTQQAQTGVASVRNALQRTQTGRSRVQISTTRTQLGKSRIQLITARTITGKSRITNSTQKAQTGRSRITVATSRVQTGVAKITNAAQRTITGKSAIRTSTLRTQLGTANISGFITKTQLGKAAILRTVGKDQLGTSRIRVTVQKQQLGQSRITQIVGKPQTGRSRIQLVSSRSQTGKSYVKRTFAVDQLGTARIQVTGVRSQLGVARIQQPAVRSLTGRSRIQYVQGRSIEGVASVHAGVEWDIQGKAAVALNRTKAQQGSAYIIRRSYDRPVRMGGNSSSDMRGDIIKLSESTDVSRGAPVRAGKAN